MQEKVRIDLDILLSAYEKMCWVYEMAAIYDANREVCKYVHSTSRGHEAIQLAFAMQLKEFDYVYPYYRDESVLLGIGMSPYELMLQLLAKKDDPFSGGRHYYAHPSLRLDDKPKIPFQSSATGMQAIPSTGAALGLKYFEKEKLHSWSAENAPVVVCSLGDGAITEGEVSEAFQEAVLHELPIIYVIQDNGWSISAYGDEVMKMKPDEFLKGFHGLEVRKVDGSDFVACYEEFRQMLEIVRNERRPMVLLADVPLIGHHTSGVRREWYRPKEEYDACLDNCPRKKLRKLLLDAGLSATVIENFEQKAQQWIPEEFERAKQAADPSVEDLTTYYFAPTPVTEEKGIRTPSDGKEVVMVDAALHAMDELMQQYPEALLYGQDVGGELGGVFREAALLAKKYGSNRVFNTPIQEAFIIGSTAGMSAIGAKPVVEVQFADYIWPGLNQLFTELARSYFLSNGKWPVQSLIRVPIGAYGSGGPYHSSSVESVVCNIRGVKVVYPSNAADLKGLFKAAFLDPNPVVIFEHKGLYWSKVPGSKAARCIEPDSDYVIPLGKANIYLHADENQINAGNSCVVITYGMGVHWSLNAAHELAKEMDGNPVEILDLRTLVPLDWDLIAERVGVHGKVLLVTEEPISNGFSEALSGRIARELFEKLDAPVQMVGAVDVPAIPLNEHLEKWMLPNADKVAKAIRELLNW
jgi:2-oxoisovalerate dehydrogenase E1 component